MFKLFGKDRKWLQKGFVEVSYKSPSQGFPYQWLWGSPGFGSTRGTTVTEKWSRESGSRGDSESALGDSTNAALRQPDASNYLKITTSDMFSSLIIW